VSLVPPIFCPHRAQTKYSDFIISLTETGVQLAQHCGGKYSKTVSGARTHKTNIVEENIPKLFQEHERTTLILLLNTNADH
jgi:hypothetical protein